MSIELAHINIDKSHLYTALPCLTLTKSGLAKEPMYRNKCSEWLELGMGGEISLLEEAGSKWYANYTFELSLPDTFFLL